MARETKFLLTSIHHPCFWSNPQSKIELVHFILGARTLLGAPGPTTSNKLLGAKGINLCRPKGLGDTLMKHNELHNSSIAAKTTAARRVRFDRFGISGHIMGTVFEPQGAARGGSLKAIAISLEPISILRGGRFGR